MTNDNPFNQQQQPGGPVRSSGRGPLWFFFGLLIGAIGFFVYLGMSGHPFSAGNQASKSAEVDRALEDINKNTTYIQVQRADQGAIQFVEPKQAQSPASSGRDQRSVSRTGRSIADGRTDCYEVSPGQIHCPPQ